MTLQATPQFAGTLLPQDAIRSPWRMAGRRFMRNHLAVAGLIVIVVLMLVCFGSLFWTLQTVDASGHHTAAENLIPRYANQTLSDKKAPPSAQFWFGTDALGRDLLARFLLGGAISLSLGLSSALIAIFIGTGVGLAAGYVGGRTDAFLMRFVDVLYGLPYILLVIIMRVALVDPAKTAITAIYSWFSRADMGSSADQWANFLILLVGIGSVSWLTLARVVRGQVLSLREQPYIEAARALGFSSLRIITRHILPNILGTIIVYGTLTVPAAILSESFLSFLGLGIQPPVPSWGNLAADGMEALNPVIVQWWMITWPCAGLSGALLALNFLGDGLRDALDPKG